MTRYTCLAFLICFSFILKYFMQYILITFSPPQLLPDPSHFPALTTLFPFSLSFFKKKKIQTNKNPSKTVTAQMKQKAHTNKTGSLFCIGHKTFC